MQFFDGPTSIGTAELDPTGTGSWTMPSPAVGTYDLHATYLPAAGFAASGSAHEAHVVAPAATTTDLTASAGTTTFGESVTLTAHVVAVGSPGTPMGSVTFRDGGTVLGTASVDGTLRQSIRLNDGITFYVRWGDLIARIAMFLAALLLLATLVNRYRNSHPTATDN